MLEIILLAAEAACCVGCEIEKTPWYNDGALWARVGVQAVVGFSALGIAVWAMKGHKDNAARRATIDLIEKTESSLHYRKLHSTFLKYRKLDEFSKLHNPAGVLGEDRQDVHGYLNHYEVISNGILNGILDRKMYKQWMGSVFVRDWMAAEKFIQRERWKLKEGSSTEMVYSDRLYNMFNMVAVIFDENDYVELLTEDHGMRPPEPSGPGDESLPKFGVSKGLKFKMLRMKYGTFLGTLKRMKLK